MSNKQSSVEWFADEEDKLFTSYQKGFMNTARYILLKYRLREQAKRMHKEESKLMFECGRNFQLTGENTFEEVYNETFTS